MNELLHNNFLMFNMKKTIVFFILLLLVIVLILVFIKYNNSLKIEEFHLSEYIKYMQDSPSDIILGEISSSKIARLKAEEVWMEIYGEKVKSKKPYKVSFDSENQVWLVKGRLPKNMLGGVPYILIRKSDGKVLAVWHDR